MATYIKTLKEDNGDITYPQTTTDAVLTTSGTTLETELGKCVKAEEIGSTADITPTITTAMIKDSAVTTAKLADGAVTSNKIDWTTFSSADLPSYDGSKTRSGVGTIYWKKLLPKIYAIWGDITPIYSDNSIALPYSSAFSDKSQVFTLYGAGTNFTKAFIPGGSSSIGFTYQSTGNTYALWAIAALEDGS